MRKILTMFAAFAVALVFTFLAASPPAAAAEKPEITKTVKVLIVGAPDANYVADVVARIEASGITVQIVAEPEEPALELPELPAVSSRAIIEAAHLIEPESPPLLIGRTGRQFVKIVDYQSPFDRFFSGFDNPARGKI